MQSTTENAKINYMQKTYDVAIIGGGIIGSSIAAHLAQKELSACLIDTSHLGLSASNASAGLLTPFQHAEGENPRLRDFMSKAMNYFPSFHDKLTENRKIDLGYRKNGSLYLIKSSSEISEKDEELKEVKKIETNLQFFNKREVGDIEPNITKNLVGAYHYPSEGIINNLKFLKAIKSYCSNNNIAIYNHKVIDITLSNNQIHNLTFCGGETINAGKIIIANGAWANELLEKMHKKSMNIIKAIKGEILEIEIEDIQLAPKKIIFTNNGYLFKRDATNKLEKSTIIVGSTMEDIDLNKSFNPFNNTPHGISELSKLFQEVLPNINNSRIAKIWSGLRPATIDKLPIIGKDSNVNNLYYALGHYRNGILMGPITGKIICDLITMNETDYNIDLFNPERFLSQQTKTKELV